MTLYPKMIMDALATVRYPGTGKNIVEAGMVEDDLRISGLHVSFSLIKKMILLYCLLTDFLMQIYKKALSGIKNPGLLRPLG